MGHLQINTEEIQLVQNQTGGAEALAIAEAGLNDALARLRQDPGWRTGLTDKPFASGSYTVAVDSSTVTSTAVTVAWLRGQDPGRRDESVRRASLHRTNRSTADQPMRLRTKTALGIDIGERRISVALVESNEQGVRVLAAASADLPAGDAGPQESTHGKVLSRLLAQLGRRSQIRRARAAVALSADSMVTQLLDLPKHVPTNIGEFVRSELQQYVALSGKNVVSDFCGVGSGVQKRLLAVAADVDEIQEMVEACSAAGIAVDAVEPSMLAYARAFLEQRETSAARRRCADRHARPAHAHDPSVPPGHARFHPGQGSSQ